MRRLFPPLAVLLLPFLLLMRTALAASPTAAADERIALIIFLRQQPQAQIAEQVWRQKSAEIETLSAELRRLDPLHNRLETSGKPLSRAEEYALVESLSRQPTDRAAQAAQRELAEQIEEVRRAALQEILQESRTALQPSQDALSRLIESWGGTVTYRYLSLNAIAVRLPPESLPALQSNPLVAEVVEDRPLETLLNNSTPTTGAPFFWELGFTGAGVDVAVVDTGIDAAHPALSGKVAAQRRCLDTADMMDVADLYDPTSNDVNGHGTHVAGTVASQDTTYRGVAYGIRGLLNAKAGFSTDGFDNSFAKMYDSDAMACVDWAVLGNAYAAEVVNLSFGACTNGSDDSAYNRFWDAVVSQLNAVAAIAAGNITSTPCTQTVFSPSTAYNVLSIANVEDKNTSSLINFYPSRADDTLRTTSSRGPTPAGRKKPDLAAPGTSIISTDNSWNEYGSYFVSYTGTSMASPHVAAAAALVISRGVTQPLAVKALLINTAEDKGDAGWDNGYGWGYLDLYNLNAHIDDVAVGAIKAAPDFRLYAGPALTSDTATLVWHRRVGYNGGQYPLTAYPLTNLDLYAYREADNTQLQSSLSLIDNVEQVRFAADETSAVVKVKTISAAISGAENEPYALATEEGFTPRRGPHLGLQTTQDGDLKGAAGTIITVTLQVRNDGDLMAHTNSLTVTFSSGLSFVSGDALNRSLPPLAVNETDPMTYQWVFQKTDDTPQAVYLSAASNSYEETFPSLAILSPYRYFFPYMSR